MDEHEKLIAEARRLENDYGDSYEVMTHMSVLADALEAATRERDAALAAIERVRAIAERSAVNPLIRIAEILAALDGAPEPEGRWEYRGRLQSCGYVAEGYISAEHAMNGLKVELEDHPYLQMDDTAIVERARVREWLPVGGSES